ncbi:LysE family transporter [Rubrobacter aplysinae]|uniref:LysE family transporter n=1 Tax=Rubrobacter aplysinae TaxID=909625 RepID=UPI0019112432|nr:LysE family transporter [Rubrobacter aplysinae]
MAWKDAKDGRVSGLASAFGIGAGGLVHITFAVAGLSSLLASSAAAFTVVKWLGVAYLVWLGPSRLLGSGHT